MSETARYTAKTMLAVAWSAIGLLAATLFAPIYQLGQRIYGLGGRIEPGHAVAAPGQPPGDHPRAAAHLQHAARRLGQRALEEAHRLLDT